jgi:hypothetical protein
MKSKAAITADQLVRVALHGNDMNRFADQADGGHFRAVSDAIPVFSILFVQLPGCVPVKSIHAWLPV